MADTKASAMPKPPVVDGAAMKEEVVAAPKSIEVIALRKGFYKQRRIAEGARFRIDSMSQFGSWMMLADPAAEAARKAKAGK